jgi:hypothetical protein
MKTAQPPVSAHLSAEKRGATLSLVACNQLFRNVEEGSFPDGR